MADVKTQLKKQLLTNERKVSLDAKVYGEEEQQEI